MRIAIHQPNYVPWCGYFAKMRHCDVFVFLDDAQMSKGSFIPRCRIRNREGDQWLTIPTRYTSGAPICEVRFAGTEWVRKHTATLRAVYARSPYFKEVFALLEPIYQDVGNTLAELNIRLIGAIADYLELPCRFEISSLVKPQGQSDDRLISLAQLSGANVYISGKGGQNYQDPAKFAEAGVQLDVRTYTPIPYKQIHGDFIAGLSILDALFHLGRETIQILDYPYFERQGFGGANTSIHKD
jgi:hypothetical protein